MEGDETRQFVQIAISTEPNVLEVLGALFYHPEPVHGDEHPHCSSTTGFQPPHRFRLPLSASPIAELLNSTLRQRAVDPETMGGDTCCRPLLSTSAPTYRRLAMPS